MKNDHIKFKNWTKVIKSRKLEDSDYNPYASLQTNGMGLMRKQSTKYNIILNLPKS